VDEINKNYPTVLQFEARLFFRLHKSGILFVVQNGRYRNEREKVMPKKARH